MVNSLEHLLDDKVLIIQGSKFKLCGFVNGAHVYSPFTAANMARVNLDMPLSDMNTPQ